MWKHGKTDDYSWGAKVFDEGSKYGIGGGTVSKLFIRNKKDEEVFSYDRGLDFSKISASLLIKVLENINDRKN